MKEQKELIKLDDVSNMIYEIRGEKVMFDFDLAKLYDYSVKALNQQVKNNISKFPDDFMFRLTKEEFNILRSKILTTKKPLFHRKKEVELNIYPMLLQNKEFICSQQF